MFKYHIEEESPHQPIKGVDQSVIAADPYKSRIDGEVISSDYVDEYNDTLVHAGLVGEFVENRDPLIRERGFSVLDKMLDTSPEVKKAYWDRIDTIIGQGFRIDPAKQGCTHSEEMAAFVKWNFDNFLKCDISSFMRKMMDATRQGWKLAEIVWKVIEYGPYKGKIGLYDLKVRNARNYSIGKDKNGCPNHLVEGVSSTGYAYNGDQEPKLLPLNKFAIYSHNPLDDDIASMYGSSDFRAAWRPHYGDITAHRLELRSAETFARAPIIGQIDHEEYTKPEQAKIRDDMTGVYQRIYTQIPEGVKYQEIGKARSDSRAFDSLQARHTKQAERAMLAGGENKETLQLFYVSLDAMSSIFARSVMEMQIIRRMVNMNYFTSAHPMFIIPKLAFNRNERMDFLEKAIEKGVIGPDEPWLRSYLDIPRQDLESRDRQQAIKRKDRVDIGDSDPITLENGPVRFIRDRTGAIRQFSRSGTLKDVIERSKQRMAVFLESDTGRIIPMGLVKIDQDQDEVVQKLRQRVKKDPSKKIYIGRLSGESEDGDVFEIDKVLVGDQSGPQVVGSA